MPTRQERPQSVKSRRLSDIPVQQLPPYTYVPGVTPHPVSDPRGHWHGSSRPVLDFGQAIDWGRELFDHGFYWEAHEVWEGAWMLAGRTGPEADFIKGLIKLAASGVKCLEGNRQGAIRHALRAEELLSTGASPVTLFSCEQLIEFASGLAGHPPVADDETRAQAHRCGVPVLGPLPVQDSDV